MTDRRFQHEVASKFTIEWELKTVVATLLSSKSILNDEFVTGNSNSLNSMAG